MVSNGLCQANWWSGSVARQILNFDQWISGIIIILNPTYVIEIFMQKTAEIAIIWLQLLCRSINGDRLSILSVNQPHHWVNSWGLAWYYGVGLLPFICLWFISVAMNRHYSRILCVSCCIVLLFFSWWCLFFYQ